MVHLVEIATYLETPIGWFFIDCLSDRQENGKRKFIPVDENDIKSRLDHHLNHLSLDKQRGLLVFLETVL